MNLIMFDMDGTLFRTETSFFPAVHDFAGKYGFSQPSDDFLRGFIGKTGEEWKAWVESLHLGKPTDELDQEFDALERHYVNTQGQLYPGVPDVLRTLAANNWHLGICSNAPPWYPELILTNAGVRDLFDLVRVPKRSGETKPMMLGEVWNELRPEQCAMVGDRADDMQAAHAGGYFAIGAIYGWAPEELVLADIRIHDIAEVPTALARHWSQEGEPKSAGAPTTVASALVVAEAPAPLPSIAQTASATPRVQESLPGTPKVSVPQRDETPSQSIETPSETAPEPMPETPAITQPVEPATPEKVVEPAVETPAIVAPVEPATPDEILDTSVEPPFSVQPVEPPTQTSPEPRAKAPAVAAPVEPVVTPPAPATPLRSTPEVVTSRPAEPEPAVTNRRFWNPFRRHEDKPR